MGYIKEPEGINFVIKSKPLTIKQEKELSSYIAKRKLEILEKTAEKLYPKRRVTRSRDH
jgi:hypothetical protein